MVEQRLAVLRPVSVAAPLRALDRADRHAADRGVARGAKAIAPRRQAMPRVRGRRWEQEQSDEERRTAHDQGANVTKSMLKSVDATAVISTWSEYVPAGSAVGVLMVAVPDPLTQPPVSAEPAVHVLRSER